MWVSVRYEIGGRKHTHTHTLKRGEVKICTHVNCNVGVCHIYLWFWTYVTVCARDGTVQYHVIVVYFFFVFFEFLFLSSFSYRLLMDFQPTVTSCNDIDHTVLIVTWKIDCHHLMLFVCITMQFSFYFNRNDITLSSRSCVSDMFLLLPKKCEIDWYCLNHKPLQFPGIASAVAFAQSRSWI